MKPAEVFEKVRRKKRNNLTEEESRLVLKYYDIPMVDSKKTTGIEDALEFAKKIGYPLVLKIVSPDIIHKTDVGGVVLDVEDEHELRESYQKMLRVVRKRAPKAEIEGINVQDMVEGLCEVIIGGKKDPTFGQTIAFGMGGIFVEVYKDISFRVVPINREDAEEMMKEIKGYKVLEGYRGKPAADIGTLVDVLMKVSAMLEKEQDIKELDINPIFAAERGAVAADARIIIE